MRKDAQSGSQVSDSLGSEVRSFVVLPAGRAPSAGNKNGSRREASMKAALGGMTVLVCLWLAPGVAHGENPGSSPVPLSNPLVVSGSPVEAEQREAEQRAKQSTPEAIAERAASTTAFANLDTSQSAKVAAEAFPAAIQNAGGGPPPLQPGQKIHGLRDARGGDRRSRRRAPWRDRISGANGHSVLERLVAGGSFATRRRQRLRSGKRHRSGPDTKARLRRRQAHGPKHLAHTYRPVDRRSAGWFRRSPQWGERHVREHADGHGHGHQADHGGI